MSNVTETPDKGEPDHFAEIAAELRRAADGIETLVGSGLPKPGLFELNIQPGTRDDDESTRRSVDAIAWALCGESGKVRDVSAGRYHFSAKGRSGPISFSVYLSVSAEWAVKREAAAELAKREAELEKLRAEVADLRSGLGYSREADDPTPVSPARVPLRVAPTLSHIAVDGHKLDEPVTRYFSFGHGHTDSATGESLIDKYVTVVAPDAEACHAAMLAAYGDRWAFPYTPGTPQADEWIPQWTEHARIDATSTTPVVEIR